MIGFYCKCGEYIRIITGRWNHTLAHQCKSCNKVYLVTKDSSSQAVKVKEA